MLFAIALSALSASAHDVEADADAPPKLVSITFSPAHLVMPVVEVTAEVSATDKLGLAVVGGGGTAKNDAVEASVMEVGGSLRYYLVGDFQHGMQVGAEVLYLHASADVGEVSAVASGVAWGPFIGYKIIA